MTLPAPPQVPTVEGHVAVPGARLWFWDTGGQGDTVVLSHPASQDDRIWLYQQPALAGAGYRVVAYARRGYGRSDPVTAANPGTEVGDVLSLFDALHIEQAHVVGAAAGGGVAMRLAAAHPARVRSLVIAGSILSPSEADWRALYANLGIAAVKPHLSAAFIELGPSYRASCPDGAARFQALSEAAHAGRPRQQPSGFDLTWASLEAIRVPVLLVTGEADLYAPPPLQRLHAAHLPTSSSTTLREVGHAPYWEAPEPFNALVLDFLARHRGRAPHPQ